MKKIIGIILITIAILFWIFAPLLIVLLPEIETSYKDIVLNWSDVGELLDKFVQIMSAALIPILIFYFGKEDADRKELEMKKQKLKKEQKYREQSQYLVVNIQKAFKKIHDDISLDLSQVQGNIINFASAKTFDQYYAEKFQNYISLIFAEKEQRTLVNRILTRMNIFSEDQHRDDIKHSFFIDSLMKNYKTEWGNEPSNNVRSFCNVVEKLAEEFDSDKHLETVIEILKDIDE